MRYGRLFLLLAIAFAVQAIWFRGLYWLFVWPAVSFGLVGLAYLKLGPGVFGKHPTGTMSWFSVLVLFPYLLLTWFTWHLVRLLSKEDCYNEVVPGLFVGRRPLNGEIPKQVTLLVDLTAEFPACRAACNGREYVAAPMLDASVASEASFTALVRQIAGWDGPVYIHCAQGHGRTGMVAAAVLVARGHCSTAEEAVAQLQAVRPALDLRPTQMAFVQRICESIRLPSG